MRAELSITLFFLRVAGGVNITIVSEVAARLILIFTLRIDELVVELVVGLYMRRRELVRV